MTPAQRRALAEEGYLVFGPDPATARWAAAANRAADAALADPALRARWLVCEGTWFIGVDALPSDAAGSVAGVPLDGPAIRALSPLPPLHPAQLSVTYPGYPRPRAGETAAAARYRRQRDGAHLDGLKAEGPERRRFAREPHAFILGLPLNRADSGASPLVIWPGSPRHMRTALAPVLANGDAADADVTEAYGAARAEVFETCPRVALPLEPGMAVLLHPLMLHGVALWQEGARADGGRRIAYFRPPAPSLSALLTAWADAGAVTPPAA